MDIIQIKKREHFSLNKRDCIERVQVILSWNLKWDFDLSAFLVGKDGVIQDEADFVYYNSRTRACTITREKVPYNRALYSSIRIWQAKTMPISADGSVILLIDDNRDINDEEECYETMYVDLSKISPNIKEIIFCATIPYEESLGDMNGLSITLSNARTKEKLCCYNIKENFSTETALEVAKLVRKENNEWGFEAIGKGHDGGLQTLVDIYA